jgi:cytochrome c oxidase subunit 2
MYEPENKKLEGWLVVLTSVGVAAMLAPGLVVWAKFVDVPKDAAVVEVVGKQWYWSYRFPGADGVLGTDDARFISDKNPFGINPDDPHGQDDVLIASPSSICRWASRTRRCSAPLMCCTTSPSRSSG